MNEIHTTNKELALFQLFNAAFRPMSKHLIVIFDVRAFNSFAAFRAWRIYSVR